MLSDFTIFGYTPVMRRALLSFMIASTILLATTFAGMAVFGMDSGAAMNHGACMGSNCASMPGAMSGMECVNHCLSVVPTSSPASAFSFLLMLAVGIVAFFLSDWFIDESRSFTARRHWREGIGKFLLHQSLSTIVLRN